MRRLSRRYLAVLIAVAALIAADQAVIQPLLVRMNVYAPVINLAGRQRMLSQKLAKAALAMDAADAPTAVGLHRAELREALAAWTTAHNALRRGDELLAVPPIRTPALDDAWAELEPHYNAMQRAAGQLVDDSVTEEVRSDAVRSLVDAEAPFLATMERIVSLMEGEAAGELRRLRSVAVAIAGAILALLLGVGAFVVRPAARAIREQVDQLEARVAQRTGELNDALASLRHEAHAREQTESRNRSLASQLAHADRVESLGRLATGLAHELNQPLGAIANYAEAANATLAAPWSDELRSRLQGYLRHVQQASLRAGAIVRRIRNFVRPGEASVAPVDMGALVGEIVELLKPEAARMHVELSLHIPDEPAVVAADPIQIQQVLVNLVQNALQAMADAPTERRRLAIGVSLGIDGVQVDVQDNGPGLAGADTEGLFEAFHTTKPDGLGVGLSICRSIVEHHRGTIWAKSLPHSGAQFSFVLPLAAEDALQPAR